MSVTEEIGAWKATISNTKALQVVATTPSFVTFKYERTPYVKAKVTLTFPEGYPSNHHLLVSIDGLVPGLSKKLVREMENVATKTTTTTTTTEQQSGQIQPVVEYFTQFMETNRFVPCWKEVRKLVDMAKQSPDTLTVLSLQETAGSVRLKFTHGEYYYDCKLTINPGYPSTSTLEDPLRLSLVKSNFPKQIVQDIVAKQVKGFVRYLQDGVPVETAWVQSNPIQVPSSQSKASQDAIETASGDPTPSLLPLVSKLRDKLQQLPSTPCPGCQSAVLPAKPNQLAALYETKKGPQGRQRPYYSACGCWFHYKCLNTALTEPPFGLSCPTCGRRVYHTDWSADTKALERAYAERQARQREMDDVAMMF